MRRKYFIYVFCVLAALAVGCSRTADVEMPDVTDEDAWIHDISLPVPVEFDLPSTKGVVDDLSDLVDNSSVFGIFAVDKKATDFSVQNSFSKDMFNRFCTYVGGDSPSLRFGYKGENRTLYYPVKSDTSFNFYTYYTRTTELVSLSDATPVLYDGDDIQAVSEASSTDAGIYVAISVARPYDVLYGAAEVDPYVDGIDGFNADYIRTTGKRPVFSFSHPAAGLGFRVQYDAEGSSAVGEYEYLELSALVFNNVPTKAVLCIVDLTNKNNNGKFVQAVATSEESFWIKGNTGNLAVPLVYCEHAAGSSDLTGIVSLGSEHFMMPAEEITMTAEVVYWQFYRKSDGTIGTRGRWPLSCSFTLNPAKDAADLNLKGFEAGQMYRYLLTIRFTKAGEVPSIAVTAEPDIAG